MKNTIYISDGLIVNPSTESDLIKIKLFLDVSDFYAEFDEENECFLFPEDSALFDVLENTLEVEFITFGISANFEAFEI